MRSRSSIAATSSSRFDWPRMMSEPSPGPSVQVARPASTTRWASSSSWARCASISSRISRRASAKRAAAQALAQIVAGLGQGRRPHAERHLDDAVLDQAVLHDQHDQGAAGRQSHELDVLERGLGLGRHDHARRSATGPTACASPRRTPAPCCGRSAAQRLSMLWRSSSVRRPTSSRPWTKRRRPASVGRRPAEVCGANKSPASSRSAMTLRIVAGDRLSPARRDRVREPTGSPVST